MVNNCTDSNNALRSRITIFNGLEMTARLAFDASQRTMDGNGHMRVAKTVISKAQVDSYFGHEIPDHEQLGLDPNRIYKMLRCPIELEKGADTFKGKQLLIKHTPVDSTAPQKDLTIGSVGSTISFEGGTLYADLTAWDAEGIELIESGKMKELSAGYAYTPDMTAGEYEDQPYDGVMRNISGNHVALVERGRIGPLAVISDSLPFEMRFKTMKLKKGAAELITAKLRKIAQDGISEDSTEELVREVAENIEHKPAYDEDKLRELVGDKFDEVAALLGGKAADEAPEKPEGGAEKPAEDEEQTQAERDNEGEGERLKERKDRAQAMDTDAIAAHAAKMVEAKYAARDAVEPLVGRIALDGFTDAKSIYEFALKQKGIACDGINEAGLKAIVDMQARSSAQPAPMAMDAAIPSKLTERFKRGI